MRTTLYACHPRLEAHTVYPPPSSPPRLVALAPLEPWMARITNVCYLLSIVIVSPSLISLHTTDEAAAFVQDMERYAREQRQRMQPPSAPRAAWLDRVETPHTLDLSSGGGQSLGIGLGAAGASGSMVLLVTSAALIRRGRCFFGRCRVKLRCAAS